VSNVSKSAVVRIFLADFIAADTAGKLNMIGGGLSVVGVQGTEAGPIAGNTAPFGVVFSIAVARELYGEECSAELVLEDSTGRPVSLPTPDGKGEQVLRVAQNVTFEEPNFPPGARVPRGSMLARTQWVLMFPAGLTLTPGGVYRWRLKIDHETRADWTEPFYVPAGPSPIVVG